jgi:hypothetical protein
MRWPPTTRPQRQIGDAAATEAAFKAARSSKKRIINQRLVAMPWSAGLRGALRRLHGRLDALVTSQNPHVHRLS